MTAPREDTVRPEGDDALVRHYRAAADDDTRRPSPAVRDAVRAHAQAVLAAAASPGGDPGAPARSAGAPAADSTVSAGPRPAANGPRWKLTALASVALAGLTGLLVLQFDRGSADEQAIALGAPSLRDAVPPPPAVDANAGSASTLPPQMPPYMPPPLAPEASVAAVSPSAGSQAEAAGAASDSVPAPAPAAPITSSGTARTAPAPDNPTAPPATAMTSPAVNPDAADAKAKAQSAPGAPHKDMTARQDAVEARGPSGAFGTQAATQPAPSLRAAPAAPAAEPRATTAAGPAISSQPTRPAQSTALAPRFAENRALPAPAAAPAPPPPPAYPSSLDALLAEGDSAQAPAVTGSAPAPATAAPPASSSPDGTASASDGYAAQRPGALPAPGYPNPSAVANGTTGTGAVASPVAPSGLPRSAAPAEQYRANEAPSRRNSRRGLVATFPVAVELQNAARKGQASQLDTLLIRGAPLDGTDTAGRTPLMLAVINNHPAMVKRLLASGANVSLVDKEGLTALQHARRLKRARITQLIEDSS